MATCSKTNLLLLLLSSAALVLSVTANLKEKPKAIATSASGEKIIESVAFVDFNAIVRESEAGKSLVSQAEAKTKEIRDDAEKRLSALKSQQDDIKKNAKSLSQKDIEKKARDLQSKIDEWNVTANKRQAAINAALNKNVQAINNTLREELSAIAKERGFYAIMPAEQAFYADEAHNLTQEAIKITNDKFPSMELKIEEESDKQ